MVLDEQEQQHSQPSDRDPKDERQNWIKENPDVNELSPDGRKLLEEYSGIPPGQVLAHAVSIRNRSFKIWPYPCIGQFRFLNNSLPKLPYYQPVLDRLNGSGNFLDAGCCFGQVIRFLIHNERISSKQLYAFDLEQGFIDFGYKLFRDQGKIEATFLKGDLIATRDDPGSRELAALEGQMDVVHCASVLHVWDWDESLQATKRLVSFTRAKPGSLIVGNQMGSRNPGSYPLLVEAGQNYRHNEESMARFWEQVGNETGTSWRVESATFITEAITQNLKHSWAKIDPGMCMIWFAATRQ